jgi:hypothetical protein
MNILDDRSKDHEKSTAVLDRLARSLGCSTEVFSNQAPHELTHTLELLNLWLGIKEGQDRAKVLALLRNMCAKAQASGEPVALSHAMQKPE